MAMFTLTGFQRDLMYVIAGHDQPSGQEVKEDLQKQLDQEINHGRLYPNLDTLVNRELVEKGQLDRRTNFYEITEIGEEKLAKRQDWEQQHLPDSIEIE